MSRIYGARAEETKALTTPEVAKLVRADLGRAAAEPTSPLYELTLSIRPDVDTLRIEVDGLTNAEIYGPDGRHSERANDIFAAVREITTAFNWWNDEYHDVRFYVHTVLLTDKHRAFNAQQREARTAKRSGGAR